MNRWLLTVAGIAAAGSAIAATTAKPTAPKAGAPRQIASVNPAPARKPSAVAAPTRRPSAAPTPAPEAQPRPLNTTGAPTAPAVEPAPPSFTSGPPTPTADPVPITPAVQSAAPTPVQPPATASDGAPAGAAPAAAPVVAEERDVVIRREPGNDDEGEEVEVEVELDGKTGKVLSKRYRGAPNGFSATGLIDTTPGPLRKTISLDLKEASVKEAIDAVVKEVGGGISVAYDKDVPTDARISVKVKQAGADSLLGLITQNAGIGWTATRGDGKQPIQLRITKSRTPRANSLLLNQYIAGIAPSHQMLDVILTPQAVGGYTSMRRSVLGEQRLSLECPHCKVKSTIIRQRHQPKCPKCSRTFQNDWQFCPADGTKRPADPNEWKFCPNCGKKVDVEKASEEGGISFLEDLPIVGDLFRPGVAPRAESLPRGSLANPYAVPVPGIPGLSGAVPAYPRTPPAAKPLIPNKPGAVTPAVPAPAPTPEPAAAPK